MYIKVEQCYYNEHENHTSLVIDGARVFVPFKVDAITDLPTRDVIRGVTRYIQPLVDDLSEKLLSTLVIVDKLEAAILPVERPMAAPERARGVTPAAPETRQEPAVAPGNAIPALGSGPAVQPPPGGKTVSHSIDKSVNADAMKLINDLQEEIRQLKYEREVEERAYSPTTGRPQTTSTREPTKENALADVARIRGDREYLDKHVGSSTMDGKLSAERVNTWTARWKLGRREGRPLPGANQDLFKEMKGVPMNELLRMRASMPAPMKAEFLRSIGPDDSGTINDVTFSQMFMSDAQGVRPDENCPDASRQSDRVVAGSTGFARSPFGDETDDHSDQNDRQNDEPPRDVDDIVAGVEVLVELIPEDS